MWERNIDRLPPAPHLGTWLTSSDLLVHRTAFNPLSLTRQGCDSLLIRNFYAQNLAMWLLSVSEFARPARRASSELVRFSVWPPFVHIDNLSGSHCQFSSKTRILTLVVLGLQHLPTFLFVQRK